MKSAPRDQACIPLIDLDVIADLRKLEDGPGSAYLVDLYGAFAADAHSTLDRMRTLAWGGDAQKIAREAHRLKGSSGSMGATRLSTGCRQIEEGARGGSLEKLPVEIERTARLLESTMEAVRCLLGLLRPTGEGPGESAR